jgi:hypothetical protein
MNLDSAIGLETAPAHGRGVERARVQPRDLT